MNNLATKSGEFVDVKDLVETDIFQKLMKSDHVQKNEFLRLCDETRREIGEYRSTSAA